MLVEVKGNAFRGQGECGSRSRGMLVEVMGNAGRCQEECRSRLGEMSVGRSIEVIRHLLRALN